MGRRESVGALCVGSWWWLVEDGPICVAAGTCPSSCLGGVLYTDEHSLLDGPGLAVLSLFLIIPYGK